MGASVYLSDFICPEPRFRKSQAETIGWLAEAYTLYQKEKSHTVSDYERFLHRVGVSEKQIASRGYYLEDFEKPPTEGKVFGTQIAGATARNQFFSEITGDIFNRLYEKRNLPEDLIHVTCTGYRSPSAAQKIASVKSPSTIVTHSYHMGCYGAFPALRMAQGFVASRGGAVDIVHTELCTLQIQPQDPSLEQMVIQTLFADGVAAYRASSERPAKGFEVLAQTEFLLPNSEEAMSWENSETGFAMTLSKDVPSLIASHLRDALGEWEKQNPSFQRTLLKESLVAVHPGGPKIIDFVRDTLELQEAQVRHSRGVLRDRGNMSSATVPTIWNQMLEDPTVVSDQLVVSMAFGPGLTVCLALSKVVK